MTSATPTPTPSAARVARPKSLRESALDMGRSLGLMAVIMAVVLLVTPARGLIFPDRNDRMPAADYAGVVSGFHQVTGRAALAPAGLPASWRANAANLSGSSAADERLHIGFVTPGSRFAELDETTGDGGALIKDVLGERGVATTGTATIDGLTWQLHTSAGGERALSRVVDGVTIVVTGNARPADLDRLCASLH